MVSGEICYGDIVLSVKMRRIAVQPDVLAVPGKYLPRFLVKLGQGLQCLVNTAADRCDQLDLVFAEITGNVLVIAERMRSLSKSALTVHTESLAFKTKAAREKIFACVHIHRLTDL